MASVLRLSLQFRHHSHHYNRSYLGEKCTTAFHKEREREDASSPANSSFAFLSQRLWQRRIGFSQLLGLEVVAMIVIAHLFSLPFRALTTGEKRRDALNWGAFFKSPTEHNIKPAYDLVRTSRVERLILRMMQQMMNERDKSTTSLCAKTIYFLANVVHQENKHTTSN